MTRIENNIYQQPREEDPSNKNNILLENGGFISTMMGSFMHKLFDAKDRTSFGKI